MTDSLKDLLQKLFLKDVTKRPKIYELMEHPWVTKEGRFPVESSLELIR